MLARFARKLVHQIRSRIGKGLVVEFDEIENARDLGTMERQFEVFGAKMLGDGPAFCCFIVKTEFISRESKRISLDILFFFLRETSDDSRVDTTAQEDPDRDIANKLAFYRLREVLANGRFQLLVRRILDFRVGGDSPVTLDRKGIVAKLKSKAVTWRNLLDSIEGRFGPWDVEIGKEI